MKLPKHSICVYCGNDFKQYPSKNHIYCSRACYQAATAYTKVSVCENCGKEFVDQKHPDKKYCSHACTGEAQKRRAIQTCPVCGKSFQHRPGKRPQICCSRACSEKLPRPDYGGKKDCVCLQCGNGFKTRQDAPGHYCSRACFNKSRENRVILRCAECGTDFQLPPAQLNRSNEHYCSVSCLNAAMSKQKRGAGNVNYRGGSVKYRGANWRRQSRLARARDGYTCQICGKKIGKKRHDHGVHHIKAYRTFNGDFEKANQLLNLVTLCVSCHSKVEHGNAPCPQPLL